MKAADPMLSTIASKIFVSAKRTFQHCSRGGGTLRVPRDTHMRTRLWAERLFLRGKLLLPFFPFLPTPENTSNFDGLCTHPAHGPSAAQHIPNITHHRVLALDGADHPPRRSARADHVLVGDGEKVALLHRQLLGLLGDRLHVVHHLIETAKKKWQERDQAARSQRNTTARSRVSFISRSPDARRGIPLAVLV